MENVIKGQTGVHVEGYRIYGMFLGRTSNTCFPRSYTGTEQLSWTPSKEHIKAAMLIYFKFERNGKPNILFGICYSNIKHDLWQSNVTINNFLQIQSHNCFHPAAQHPGFSGVILSHHQFMLYFAQFFLERFTVYLLTLKQSVCPPTLSHFNATFQPHFLTTPITSQNLSWYLPVLTDVVMF